MQSKEANDILAKIQKSVDKSGIDADSMISQLQKAREYALKENDPLLTRALRLAWQHLEANGGFEISYLEEAETQEENFSYMLALMQKSDNTYNRDELREMTNLMQSEA
jgi:hypothetical protein